MVAKRKPIEMDKECLNCNHIFVVHAVMTWKCKVRDCTCNRFVREEEI
jgi:hypothetical protein